MQFMRDDEFEMTEIFKSKKIMVSTVGRRQCLSRWFRSMDSNIFGAATPSESVRLVHLRRVGSGWLREPRTPLYRRCLEFQGCARREETSGARWRPSSQGLEVLGISKSA